MTDIQAHMFEAQKEQSMAQASNMRARCLSPGGAQQAPFLHLQLQSVVLLFGCYISFSYMAFHGYTFKGSRPINT